MYCILVHFIASRCIPLHFIALRCIVLSGRGVVVPFVFFFSKRRTRKVCCEVKILQSSFILGRQFELKFRESDLKKVNKGLTFSKASTKNRLRMYALIYQRDLKKQHSNYFYEPAFSVRVGKYWSHSFLSFVFMQLSGPRLRLDR